MRIYPLTLAVMMIGLAAPALAQQTQQSPPDVQKRAEAVVEKWTETINKGDVKGLAQLFTANAMQLDPYGVSSGTQQIEQDMQRVVKLGLKIQMKVDRVEPLGQGQEVVVAGSYTGTYANNPATPTVQGHFVHVVEPQTDAMKIRIASFSRSAPSSPATGSSAPTTGTTTPSNR